MYVCISTSAGFFVCLNVFFFVCVNFDYVIVRVFG